MLFLFARTTSVNRWNCPSAPIGSEIGKIGAAIAQGTDGVHFHLLCDQKRL